MTAATATTPQRPDKPPVYAVGHEKCFWDGMSLRNIHPSGKLVGSGSLRGDCDQCKLTTEFERPAPPDTFPCDNCGKPAERRGSKYRCANCGTVMGCS